MTDADDEELANQVALRRVLGLTKQRVSVLVRKPDFPKPARIIGGKPFWDADKVRAWDAKRSHRPGRTNDSKGD